MSGFEITVPGVRLVSEANAHEHFRYRQRRAKDQHTIVDAWLRSRAFRVEPPCEVRITRFSPATLDTDNLQGSAKHVRDAIAAWLGVDDKDPRVTWHVGQERRKTYGVRIAVRPWSPTAVGSRVALEGSTTTADITLDPARLRELALALTQLADGGPSVDVTVHALRVTYHRTET